MSTNVKTGLVRFSYPAVFVPKGFDEGGEKYGVVIIIPKTDKTTVEAVKAAIQEAWEQGKAKGYFKTATPPALKNPLKDGDNQVKDGEDVTDPDPALFGAYYINAYSSNKPGLIDKFKEPITSPDHFYAGCYGRVTMNFYAYGVGKKGVAAGLNNIQKLKEGVRLDGRRAAEDEFDDNYADNFLDEDDDYTTPTSTAKKSTAPKDDYDDL